MFDILDETVSKGLEKQDLSDVHTIFIDEIQSTHGHNYITMVADQNHRMIAGVEGHDTKSVDDVKNWLKSKGCEPSQIKFVSADMSTAYKSGVDSCFPNAKIIYDHFHVVKSVNEVVDKVRKRTLRELSEETKNGLKHIKHTVLYRKINQNDKHRERMEKIRLLNPELASAFDLKEEFFGIFEKHNRTTARSAFFSWYNRVRGSKIPEMVAVSKRMLKRLNDILRWFDHKVSNAVAEGLNSAYKKIKSAACGYKEPQNLIDMCLFRKGRLNVSI